MYGDEVRYIENGVCRITYPNGKMLLAMDRFFPAPAHDVRVLFAKVIRKNCTPWKAAEEILEWLKEAHMELDAESAMKAKAAACAGKRDEAERVQAEIDRQAVRVRDVQESIKSLPRGKKAACQDLLTAEKEKLKRLKEKLKWLKEDAKFENGEYIRIRTLERKLRENISLIEQLTAGW